MSVCSWRLSLISAVVALAACDPYAGVSSTVTVRPAPRLACLDSALKASQLLTHARIMDDAFGRRYEVEFRDLSPRGLGYIIVQSRDTSVATLCAEVGWPGLLGDVPEATRATFGQLTTKLVRELQAVCARAAPLDTVVCTEGGMFTRKRRCRTKAT